MQKALILFMGVCLFLSCSNNTPVVDEPETSKEYIVSLGFSGEITQISESPLRSTEKNDLYGIQVYTMPVQGGGEYRPYAYGLFDDKASMTIRLLGGYKYKFVSTMVVDGKNKLLTNSTEGYYTPFYTNESNPLNNAFTYSSSKQMASLSWGSTYLINPKAIFHRPNLDRYYGQVEDYTPSDNGSVSINMKRVSFGLKVEVEGVTEGKVKISLSEAPDLYIEYPETEIEQIFTFQNPYNNLNWTNENYSEVVTVSVNWIKTDGGEVPIATQDIEFKRNMLTTIQVKVNDALMDNSLTLTTEDTEMGDGGTINLEGDGGVETPVDPNP